MAKLLREWIALDYTPAMVNESREKNDGKIMLPCILQKAHLKNQNGRIYPKEVLIREVENYIKVVQEARALVELDHPETSTVALDRASHIIREIYWEGDTVRGVVEVLPTPKGQILAQLLDAGVRIGMSSRGVGSTEATNEGTDIVQSDYGLICFDAVSEPSTPGAFINENIKIDTNKMHTKSDRIWRALNDVTREK